MREGGLQAGADGWRDELLAQALRAGQRCRLRVASGSMVPALRPGDLVSVDRETPRVGEIALARIRERWVVHRVIAADEASMLLCGDARWSPAHREPRERIVGRVVGCRRDLKARLLHVIFHLRGMRGR